MWSKVLSATLCFSSWALAREGRLAETDFTSAKDCGQCHQQIYNQWTQSMHSKSYTDPLYRMVVDEMIRRGDEQQKVFCQ